MSSGSDKIKGVGDQVAGTVKQGVGKAVGNEHMQAEGAMQKAKGTIEKGVGTAKDKVKAAIDRA